MVINTPLSSPPHIPHFRPFFAILPLWQPKKPKFWKTEKNTWRYHHFTHHDNMLYCSLDMVRIRYNCYFSLWAIFCPFTPPNSPKNQNFEKMKKNSWRYHHFTFVYHKWQYIMHDSACMDRRTDRRMDGKSDI